MTRNTLRATFTLLASLLLTIATASTPFGTHSLRAQCGGTDDLPVAPLPLLPGATGHSEVGPNSFVLEAPFPICLPTPAPVAGVGQVDVGGHTCTHIFATPTPASPGPAPTIDVVDEGGVSTRALSGSALHAGATLCTPSESSAVAVTDVGISVLVDDRLEEFAFPAGVVPVGAAAVGFCPPGGAMWIVMVETTGSIELVLGPVHFSVPLAAPTVAPSLALSNGDTASAVVFTDSEVLLVSLGETTAIPLPGSYVSHSVVGASVLVSTTAGPFPVALPSGAMVTEFAPCTEILDSAGADATDSAIAVLAGPCGGLSGVKSTWPSLAALCGGPVGPLLAIRPLPPGGLNPKWAKVRARAATTLGGTAVDPGAGGWRRRKIFTPVAAGPLAPGFGRTVRAFAFSGSIFSDYAWARATARAALVPAVPPRFNVTLTVQGGAKLVHQQGHMASYSAAAKDPVRIESWDHTEDLIVDLEFSDTFLPVDVASGPDSRSTFRFDAATTIPGFPNLFEGTVSATHDGVDPQLDVDFTSLPALGLDDAAITATIASLFLFDPVLGGYSVGPAAPVLTSTLDVPTGVSTFEMTYDSSVEGVIYEPGYNGPPVDSICGNGIVESNEECDAPDGVGCSQDCALTGLETRLILEVPDAIGPAPLPLILENPAATSEFSVALCSASNPIFGFGFEGTATEFLNPELVLQQVDPAQGIWFHVIFDALPPYDTPMLPPLAGQPIAVIDAFVNAPNDFHFCDDTIQVGSPLPGQPSQQTFTTVENFVVNHGTELQLQGDGLVTQVLVLGTGGTPFVRGDVNGDGAIDISDPIAGLLYLFPPTPTSGGLLCEGAFDANDDDALNIGDAVFLLSYLFQSPSSPVEIPQPFPLCAPDPTPGLTLCTQALTCP